MGLGTILLIILVLMLVGVLPTWPHSREWGESPRLLRRLWLSDASVAGLCCLAEQIASDSAGGTA